MKFSAFTLTAALAFGLAGGTAHAAIATTGDILAAPAHESAATVLLGTARAPAALHHADQADFEVAGKRRGTRRAGKTSRRGGGVKRRSAGGGTIRHHRSGVAGKTFRRGTTNSGNGTTALRRPSTSGILLGGRGIDRFRDGASNTFRKPNGAGHNTGTRRWDHKVDSPRDAATGLPTGKRFNRGDALELGVRHDTAKAMIQGVRGDTATPRLGGQEQFPKSLGGQEQLPNFRGSGRFTTEPAGAYMKLGDIEGE